MKAFLLAIALALMSLPNICAQCTEYDACPSCPGGVCPQAPSAEQPAIRSLATAAQYPAVVIVDCGSGQTRYSGTGFIAARSDKTHRAIVVTCAHVFKGGGKPSVQTQDGRAFFANILTLHRGQDVAVLEIADPGIAPMLVAEHTPPMNDKITMVGFAHRRNFLCTTGNLRGGHVNEDGSEQSFIEASCRTEEGCSGGPLLDSRGYVCGTVTGYVSNRDTIGPCLPYVLPRIAGASQTSEATLRVSDVHHCDALDPWRRRIEQEIERRNDTPATPAFPAAPATPIVITQPAAPAAPCGPDPGVLNALQNLGSQVQQHGQRLDALDSVVGKVAENQAKHGTLLERIEAKREGIGQDASGGDDRLRMVLIVGGIVVFFVLAIWNIMHGKGLFRQLIDRVAAANPQNARLQTVASRVDTTEDSIAAALGKYVPGLTTANSAIDAKIQAALPADLAAALTGHPVLAAAAAAPVAVQAVQSSLAALQSQVSQQAATVAQVALNTPAPGQTTGGAIPATVGNASNPAPAAGTTINVATPSA